MSELLQKLVILLASVFLLGGWNLKRFVFDHSNIFQSQNQLSVNTENQLKSKLA